MSDSIQGISAQNLINTNSTLLEEKFGYKPKEAEKIVELLGSMKVAQGREPYFAQHIQPVIEKALAGKKNEKGFRAAVMKDLGMRSDTAFNLKSPVGKSSYMQTESFRNSGLDEAGLQSYMQRVPHTSGMSQSTPVYARALTEGMKTEPLQRVAFQEGSTLVIEDAKIELSGMYDYTQEDLHTSFLPPALIVGDSSMSDSIQGISVQDLIKTNSTLLEEKFGYKPKEAEKIVELLGSMKVAQGREPYFAQHIQPVIESALAGKKNEKEFRVAVMKDLGMRSDTAFNLRSPVGKSSYMQTESFRNSGLDEAGLQSYMQQVPHTSGMSQSTPVYARTSTGRVPTLGQARNSTSNGRIPAIERGMSPSGNTRMPESFVAGMKKEPLQRVEFGQARNSASTGRVPSLGQATSSTSTGTVASLGQVGNSTSTGSVPPLGQGRSSASTGSVPSLGQASSTSTGRIPAVELGTSASGNTRMPSAMPGSSVSLPRNYETPSMQTKSASSPVNDELARLRRMEENYEKDKAMLRQEAAPALARSASHDIGHAEDDGVAMVADEDDVKQMSVDFNHVLKELGENFIN